MRDAGAVLCSGSYTPDQRAILFSLLQIWLVSLMYYTSRQCTVGMLQVQRAQVLSLFINTGDDACPASPSREGERTRGRVNILDQRLNITVMFNIHQGWDLLLVSTDNWTNVFLTSVICSAPVILMPPPAWWVAVMPQMNGVMESDDVFFLLNNGAVVNRWLLFFISTVFEALCLFTSCCSC